VQTCAERREDLRHVLDQVVVYFSWAYDDKFAALHRQGGLTYSAANLAKRSLCSSTMRATDLSRSRAKNLRRWPPNAGPT